MCFSTATNFLPLGQRSSFFRSHDNLHSWPVLCIQRATTGRILAVLERIHLLTRPPARLPALPAATLQFAFTSHHHPRM